MTPILTNVGKLLNFDRYRVIIPAVKAMREVGWWLVDKSYYIVPAICQECFDDVKAYPNCRGCSFLKEASK